MAGVAGHPERAAIELIQTTALTLHPKKCKKCKLCDKACPMSTTIDGDACISCGQCSASCPYGVLVEKDHTGLIKAAKDAGKVVILQTAPATRVAVGEPFGDAPGTIGTGKMVSAARALGFDKVFDVNFGADMTILEEAAEFLERYKAGNTPMFTSCCPAWMIYVQKHHPEIAPFISTCKSPHMMQGAAMRAYFRDKLGIPNAFIVSMMPCTAKKIERLSGDDVDCSLTTREFCQMIKAAGIDWAKLPEGQFDPGMSEASGGGAIFGVTGGVMEAALRTAVQTLTNAPCQLAFEAVRGSTGVKEASLPVADKTIRVAVCSGIRAAKEIIESGKFKEFDFIEVMACPGGCCCGGGQPVLKKKDLLKDRQAAIYKVGEAAKCGQNSLDNGELRKLYADYLTPHAHALLHRHTPLLERITE